jgi:small subunit ribosomal protein S9
MMAEKKQYIPAVGRRKTASARVRITPASKGSITVNEKPLADYFGMDTLTNTVESALATSGSEKFVITAKIAGGGIKAQAQALRHGIARALVKYNEEFRKDLKVQGFLTRDPRAKERRKFGLKKARKAPQWSKR